MSNHVQRNYYEDDVLNATPQRLRLMLIDGAIRFAKSALSVWESDRNGAMTAMCRCRNIIIELIGGIRADRPSCEHIVDHTDQPGAVSSSQRKKEIDRLEQIARNTMAVYLVVFRHLDEAQLDWDAAKLSAAIEVLNEERETMRLVCQKLPHAPALNAPHLPTEISTSEAARVLDKQSPTATPSPATYGEGAGPTTTSMSFEA